MDVSIAPKDGAIEEYSVGKWCVCVRGGLLTGSSNPLVDSNQATCRLEE